jgi:peptidoglycan/LPS O-acetylase OafA/YrhL
MDTNKTIPKGSITSARSPDYRPDIDGLRALAVIAVILNHFNKSLLPSGHLGVDIFFVISGYVITSSLARHPGKDLKEFLLAFYSRRIKRLQPALVFYVLLASFLICLFNPAPAETIRTGIASLFGVSNLFLFQQATNYFARAAELNIFTHTWSLGVEEQFYLVFPVLAWATGFARQQNKGFRNLGIVTGVLSVASFLAFVSLSRTNQPAAYFLMPPRFWELGIGCLMFLLLKSSKQAADQLARIPPLLPLAAILGIMSIQTKSKEILLLVLLTALLIACLKPGTSPYRILTGSLVLYIGKISYSLYLWHWGILCLSRWTLGIYWWTVPFQLILMVGLAMLSYHFIESPLRTAAWSPSRLRVVGLGFGASAAASTVLAAIGLTPLISLFTGRMSPVFAEGGQSMTKTYALTKHNSSWQGKKCVLHDNTEVGKEIALINCTLGDFSMATRRILVIGNSFSITFTTGFDQLVLQDNYAVAITSSFGAAPSPDIEVSHVGYNKSNIYYWKFLVPRLISQLQRNDWVFIVNDLAGFSPEQSSELDRLRIQQFKRGLLRLSDELSPKGIRIAVLHGLPFARDAKCVPAVAARQWYNSIGDGPCRFLSKKETLQRRQPLDTMLKDLQANGEITVIDLFDIFCPGELCTYNAENGELLYRDEHSHPSIEAVRLSAPSIRAILAAPIP